MQTRRIGSLEVSTIGLGTNNFGWRLGEAASAAVVHAALDAGVTFFDTADVYGAGQSEAFLGRALGPRRADVVVATKFGKPMGEGRPGAHPAYVARALEASLRRLGTDHVDLYQLHAPDPDVPIEDTLGALGELVRAGKAREVGCSNFSAEEVGEADAAHRAGGGAARFVSVQNEYSLLDRSAEADVLPACERLGLTFLPYFPLASGLLTGKYRRGRPAPAGTRIAEEERYAGLLTEGNLAAVERLAAFAAGRGRTLLELALSWPLARRAVASVIAGATSPEQVRANAAAGAWALSGEELAAVDEIVGAPA